MKKLSKELSKTYIFIFLFLIFTHTVSLYLVKVHMNNHIKEEVKIVRNFIKKEIIQDKNNEMKYFLEELESEEFFKELYFYTFSGIILAIIFTFFIAERFLKKLLPQLEELETVNEKVDFNTFKIDIDKNSFYQEFSNFLISYESMLERLKLGAEKQTDFINSASHEIKTPLSIIKGYSDILKKRGRGDSKIFLESVKTIQEETRNMTFLVEKLLFLSKQGKLDLFLEKISLIELIEEVIVEMKIIYPNQKINFHMKNVYVNSDWNLLKQVIRNLVDNSIKYGCGNLVGIYIQDRRENVVICIKDSGVGISKQNLKNIFDKFYRIDKSRSKEIGGHGLGLSIVETILKSLNGQIEIKSILGEKTEVFLTFKKYNK